MNWLNKQNNLWIWTAWCSWSIPRSPCREKPFALEQATAQPVTIAVARDKAFVFCMKKIYRCCSSWVQGWRFFSPLEDKQLPDTCCGLYLCGGYPELYGAALAANKDMLTAIKHAIDTGMPVIAECGGFLYLHQILEDAEGKRWPFVGALPGKAWPTEKLQRFGYITLEAQGENLSAQNDLQIRGHEFHYWESDCCGDGFLAQKQDASAVGAVSTVMRICMQVFLIYIFTAILILHRGFIRKGGSVWNL